MTEDARAIWRRRLAHLEAAEASASDAGQRFTLGEQIREAKDKLAELNVHHARPPRCMRRGLALCPIRKTIARALSTRWEYLPSLEAVRAPAGRYFLPSADPASPVVLGSVMAPPMNFWNISQEAMVPVT